MPGLDFLPHRNRAKEEERDVGSFLDEGSGSELPSKAGLFQDAAPALAAGSNAPRTQEPEPHRSILEQDPDVHRRMAFEGMERVKKGREERDVLRDTLYEWEGKKGDEARMAMDSYYNSPEGPATPPDPDFATEIYEDSVHAAKVFLEFVAGDEMGLIGMKWDDEGFEWSREVFMDQVTEHPYSSAFTIATYAAPWAIAARKGAKLLKYGADLAKKAGVDESVAAGRGIWGQSAGAKFDDHAGMVQMLAQPDMNNGYRYFDDNILVALKKANSPDEISQIVPEEMLRRMLSTEYRNDRYLQLLDLARRDELSPIQKQEWFWKKNFQNTYAEGVQNLHRTQIESMSDYFKRENIAKYMEEMPTNWSPEGGEAIYRFWLGGGKGSVKALTKQKGVGQEKAMWAEHIAQKWTSLTDMQHAEGFISDETHALFQTIGSGMHLPAVKKNTPGFEYLGPTEAVSKMAAESSQSALKESSRTDMMRILGGPTTKHRGKYDTKRAVLDDIAILETNPEALMMGGYVKDNLLFQLNRTFRDVLVDFKETGKYAESVTTKKNWDAMGPDAQAHWMPLSDMNDISPGLGDRVKRMINKRVAKDGLDPAKHVDDLVLDKRLVEQFYGVSGAAEDTAKLQKLYELGTAVYKTSKTSMHPPTHFGNMVGNMHFMTQQGMNPFAAVTMKDGQVGARVFGRIAKQMAKNKNLKMDDLMTKDNIAKHLGKDRYTTNHLGQKIDLADLYSDPIVNDLFEAQAFESVEGFASTERMMIAIRRAEGDTFSVKATEVAARAIAGYQDIPGVKPILRKASAAYLAEDMVPKLQMITELTRKGWSRQAAVREVGQRLPQYKTVGRVPKSMRRHIFPWITFSAEAARITKNNMADFPIRMSMHIQAPQIIQGGISAAGMGPETREEQFEAIKAGPEHAARYGSAVISGDKAPELLGAMGLGLVGGIAGTVAGGPGLGAAGYAMGAKIGHDLGAKYGDPSDEGARSFNRILTNDWLTPAAIAPQSVHPDRWDKLDPWGDTDVTGTEYLKAAVDTLPVSPLSVVTPLLQIFTGRNNYGQEIATTGPMDSISKAIVQMANQITPPILGKYFGNIGGTHTNPITAAETYGYNGNTPTLPKALTPGFEGVAQEGTTFMESDEDMNAKLTGLGAGAAAAAAYYKGAKSAGASGKIAAATGIVAGGLAAVGGMNINIDRMMTDFGFKIDSRTERQADWTLEGIQANIVGVTKSFESSPQQSRRNQHYKDIAAAKARSVLGKKIKDAWRANQSGISYMKDFRESLVRQYQNLEIVDREFVKAISRMQQEVEGSKYSMGISVEKEVRRLEALKEQTKEISKVRKAAIIEAEINLMQKQAAGLGNVRMTDEPGFPGR